MVGGNVQAITVEPQPAFSDYVVGERVPNYKTPDRVIIATVLPETGVTYDDVPQSFGVTPYRYTVENSHRAGRPAHGLRCAGD